MSKKRSFVVIGVILLCTVISVVFFVRKSDDNTAKSQVQVQGTNYAGCGVIYKVSDEGCYIVSTGHIFSGMQVGDTSKVTFHDGTEVPGEVVYLSDVADVAFLQVRTVQEENDKPDVPGEAAKIDKSRFDALKEDDVIFVCAGGESHTEKVMGSVLYPWIYLEDFSLNMLLAKLEAVSGMSGCGVYDKKGYFVGILCGTSEDGEVAVLPLSVIESEWSMIVK